MKRLNYFLPALLLYTLCAATLVPDKYILATDYTITINGTSSLHDWKETAEKVTGNCNVNWNNDGSFDLDALSIIIDAQSIKGDAGMMNSKTYKALKADTYPKIIFTLTTPIKLVKINTSTFISAIGNLTIAGVTKPVSMQVKLKMLDRNKIIFKGVQTIKMTDYGIDPPTAFFGTLKTGNAIAINFDTDFVLKL